MAKAIAPSLLRRIRWCFGLLVATTIPFGNSAIAQIVPDGTLGTESSQVDGIADFVIRGGAQRQENLFHSFEQFSIDDSQRVYFENPADVERIFSRVTGSLSSDIFGTLGVNGNADLFLLNPNGIVFGPNAQLELGGSFIASTADAFQFDDLGSFDARSPDTPPPLLTIQPTALMFGQVLPGDISAYSSANETGLVVPQGETLGLVGGNVTVDGGKLAAPGGRIEIGAATGAGVVEMATDGRLAFPEGLAQGQITVENEAIATVRSAGGGALGITARAINISESTLSAGIEEGLGSAGSQAGDIVLNAVEKVNITSVGQVFNFVLPNAIGNAGNTVVIAPVLEMSDGAQMGSVVFDFVNGDAGNVTIDASESVRLEGPSTRITSIIFGSNVVGASGNIEIATKALEIFDGAQISSSTSGQGNAGDATIRASQSVRIVGSSSSGLPAGIFTSISPGTTGNGGTLQIDTQVLEVLNGGALFSGMDVGTSRFDGREGNAGDIVINANESVRISGRGAPAQFSTREGTIRPPSFVNSLTRPESMGNGGDIKVKTPRLEVSDGAQIASATQSEGDAGDIIINGQILEVVGDALLISSTQGEGDAGDILVSATDRIAFNNSRVLARSASTTNQGGDIFLATPFLALTNQSELSTQTLSADGGNIVLTLSKLLLLRNNSFISTEAGADDAGGDGGDITIDTRFIVAVPNEDSDIVADAFDGSGGNVDITATGGILGIAVRDSRTAQNDITASSQNGVSGDIDIQSPEVDVERSLIELPTAFAGSEVTRSCRDTLAEGSEFIISGRGGLPQNPLDPATTVLWQDILPIERDELVSRRTNIETGTATSNREGALLPAPIVEVQSWTKNERGQVVLVAEAPQQIALGHSVEC